MIEVNGEPLTDEEIREELRRLQQVYVPPPDADPFEARAQLREWARERLVERMLIRQEARRDTTPITPEEWAAVVRPAGYEPLAALEELELRLRVDRLLERITRTVARPKSKDVVQYYRQHSTEFDMPEQIHVRQVIRNVDEQNSEESARAVIEQAAEEIRRGAEFAEVAERYSDCPANGGDLGWISPGEMVEEFDAVAFALDAGQVSPVFRTLFGFHLVRVLERRPAGVRDLAEVRDDIERRLHRQRQDRAVAEFVAGLRAKADIRVVSSRR